MTNKDLLNKAMPLKSLSNAEWDLITDYTARINDRQIVGIIEKLCTTQARLEVTRNYLDYYFDKIDEHIINDSFSLE